MLKFLHIACYSHNHKESFKMIIDYYQKNNVIHEKLIQNMEFSWSQLRESNQLNIEKNKKNQENFNKMKEYQEKITRMYIENGKFS